MACSSNLVMSSFYHKTARHASPLRQLQLDTAVAAERLFGAIGIDRLEFPEAGGDQTLRRNAPPDQVLHDRDCARGGKVPVGAEGDASGGTDVGVAIDPQHPGDLARDLLIELRERARELVQLGAALRTQHRLPGVEEHFRLEDKAIT